MIEVLINWIFISVTAYTIGYIALEIMSRLLNFNIDRMQSPNILRILLGLAFTNIYAEAWSLLAPVGMAADLVLILISIIVIVIKKNNIVKEISTTISIKTYIYIVLILLFSYGTSRGYMHFDTNLYHAQAIRWIEEYGVVPGLANIQSRYGYNSAEFVLNALYSCKWYLGRSLHCTAGYFALISSFIVVDIKNVVVKKDGAKLSFSLRVSDFVRLGLIFYLATIYSEMISPASDYYAQLLIFDIVILWLDAIQVSKNSISTKESDNTIASIEGILCIIMAYAITIKLSLGLLVLLAFIPGLYWIKNKNYRSIITCIVSGLIIVIPYFIRNYIISGWILYPSTLIGLGTPEWQLPIGEAKYDAKEIGMWGRGITDATSWETVSTINWIPAWIKGLSFLDLILVMGTSIAIIATIVISIRCFAKKTHDEIIPLLVVLMVGTIFWFCSAPLVRYGYTYLIIMPLITIGYIVSAEILPIQKPKIWGLDISICTFALIAMCILIIKGKSLANDIIRTKDYPCYISQQDYINGEATIYNVDGVDFYVPTEAGQIGYYKFPSTVYERTDIKLRGDDIQSGFMRK